jgi:hypothetical protein
MTTTLDSFTIVSLTQRWVLLHGTWYREAWVQDAAGVLRFVAILDDLL